MPQTAQNPKTGWTPERRARQAARIRIWAPWACSTGPKTVAGKAKSARNSYKHGGRARDMRLISKTLSAQFRYLRTINAYLSLKKCQPSHCANELLEHRLYLEGRAVTSMLHYALGASGWHDFARK